ncbi:MAG: hypothetical protein ACRERC_11910 [Candidatus Binatia bacterium]
MYDRPPARAARDGTAPLGRADLLLALLLGTAIMVLLMQRPPTLGMADESYYLYESKRLYNGEILYRDVFDIVPPLAFWLMAGAYGLLGVDLSTARVVTTAVQAGIAIAIFVACRQLGVRRSLALLAAAAQVGICWPMWMQATPHWVATLCMQGFLISLLALPMAAPAARWAGPGLVLGLVVGTQHHQAPHFALAGLAVLIFDTCVAGPPGQRAAALWRRLLAYGLGTAAIVVPMFGFCIAQAGFDPVYTALVHKPLFGYRTSFGTRWGSLLLLKKEYLADWFPSVLRALPLVGVVMLAVAGWAGAWRDWARARAGFVIAVVGGLAMASIAYYPDLIHFAYVVGVFFVGAAALLEWSLRLLPERAAGGLAAAAAAAGIAYFGLHLHGVAERTAARHPARVATRFGTIAAEAGDLHTTVVPAILPLIDADPERLLFTAPAFVSLYLLTDAQNPTPFQFVVAGYTDQEEFDRIFAALDARQARHLVITWWPEKSIEPRLRDYVLRNYEAAVPDPPLSHLILRRRQTPLPATPSG